MDPFSSFLLLVSYWSRVNWTDSVEVLLPSPLVPFARGKKTGRNNPRHVFLDPGGRVSLPVGWFVVPTEIVILGVEVPVPEGYERFIYLHFWCNGVNGDW